jgi:hypothetical protein
MATEDKKFNALKIMVDQTKENAGELVNYSITVPNSAKGGQYRQLVSFDAFKKQQVEIRNKYPHWFMLGDDQDPSDNDWKETFQLCFNVKIPVIECISMWDFFDKIGWDLKSRKFK